MKAYYNLLFKVCGVYFFKYKISILGDYSEDKTSACHTRSLSPPSVANRGSGPLEVMQKWLLSVMTVRGPQGGQHCQS